MHLLVELVPLQRDVVLVLVMIFSVLWANDARILSEGLKQ